jgi:hypothetical protein
MCVRQPCQGSVTLPRLAHPDGREKELDGYPFAQRSSPRVSASNTLPDTADVGPSIAPPRIKASTVTIGRSERHFAFVPAPADNPVRTASSRSDGADSFDF